MRGPVRILWGVAALSALVGAAGLAGLDQMVARALAGTPAAFWNGTVDLLELVTLKKISTFLLGALLILAAGLLLAIRPLRRAGRQLLYLGLVQFLATTIADLSKPQLGRLRPWEAAQAGGADSWFVGANSFPSGHAAFFAGLFLPLIVLVPRLAPLWLVPPLFVAAARVAVSDHYLSDVAFAIALAAALAAALAPVARRGETRHLAAA